MKKSNVEKSFLKALIYGSFIGFASALSFIRLDRFYVGVIYFFIIYTPIFFISFLLQKPNKQFKVILKDIPDTLSSEDDTIKMFFPWEYLIVFILIIIGIWLISESVKDGIIRSIGLSLFVIFGIIKVTTTNLTISKNEIKYRTLGNCIHAKWEDLEAFEFSIERNATQRQEY